MELGLGAMHELDPERLQFAKQLGVRNIILHSPDLPGDGYYDFRALLNLRTRIEAEGLRLYAIENVPREHYDKVLIGAPGRDQQIENVCTTLRNMGRAGIPVLGYHFIVLGVWRTEYSPRGRGGAKVTIYDHAQVENAPLTEYGEISDEQMWDNITYFLRAVIPVAEEAGVRMALHPDDPPVPKIAGIARIIRSIDAYKRVMDIVPSRANAIEFCQGTVSEMPGTAQDVYDAIAHFTSRQQICYVHFRNVDRPVPDFAETFIDNGYVDMLHAMKVYHENNFDGVLIVDHTPGVVNDTGWGHRGRAYGIGYMKALLKCVTEGCV